jgi:hypothetical protein
MSCCPFCDCRQLIQQVMFLETVLRLGQTLGDVVPTIFGQTLDVVLQGKRFRRRERDEHATTGGASHSAGNGPAFLNGAPFF